MIPAIMVVSFVVLLLLGWWDRDMELRRMAYGTGCFLCAGSAFGLW